MPRILQLQEINGEIWAKMEFKDLPSPVTLYTEEELNRFKLRIRLDAQRQIIEAIESIFGPIT